MSLSRWTVGAAAGAFFGVGILLIALVCWSLQLHALADRQERNIASLENDISRQRDRLRVTEEQRDSLRAEQRRLAEEMEELRLLEGKVRRFLGLQDETGAPEGGSHQGGMGDSGEVGAVELHPPRAGGAGLAETPRGTGQALRDRLGEVFAQLQDRHSEGLHIPVLLPVASDQLWLSCRFGWRRDPFDAGRREFHNGVDIAGPWKASVIAPADGTVSRVGTHRLLGRYVKIQHSESIWSVYGHLAGIAVERGQRVTRGDRIGSMGNSGRSTGTHLHYSVQVDGRYVDPMDYIWERPFGTLRL